METKLFDLQKEIKVYTLETNRKEESGTQPDKLLSGHTFRGPKTTSVSVSIVNETDGSSVPSREIT